MKYILQGAVNPNAAIGLEKAGYSGPSASLALIEWMNYLPAAKSGISPLRWKDGEIWIPYLRMNDGRIQIELEEVS